jgi:hypothetical protein
MSLNDVSTPQGFQLSEVKRMAQVGPAEKYLALAGLFFGFLSK